MSIGNEWEEFRKLYLDIVAADMPDETKKIFERCFWAGASASFMLTLQTLKGKDPINVIEAMQQLDREIKSYAMSTVTDAMLGLLGGINGAKSQAEGATAEKAAKVKELAEQLLDKLKNSK